MNLDKTIGTFLWEQPVDAVREVIAAAVPAWRQYGHNAEDETMQDNKYTQKLSADQSQHR